ncbi:MAG: DUF3793 family protein [Lachnospiraceae bacterium]|nr:DUF3793 family protein [Lachnospiraceae bacterium]
MSDEQVIRYCAPTMANIKTANLFSGMFESYQEMIASVRRLNIRLKDKGIRILPLRFTEGRGLIYVYRPGRLSRDLQNGKACRLLKACGYPDFDQNICIRRLISRLNEKGDFPHEIGLFLGYPPEDVDGFINNKAACKYCGVWKVYDNVETAKKLFARYQKCTDIYRKQWREGKSMERLTVAVK